MSTFSITRINRYSNSDEGYQVNLKSYVRYLYRSYFLIF